MDRNKAQGIACLGVIVASFSYTLGPVMAVIGLILAVIGCIFWAKDKGRHWAFGLWGILAPIGFLGVSLLKERDTEDSSWQPSHPGADEGMIIDSSDIHGGQLSAGTGSNQAYGTFNGVKPADIPARPEVAQKARQDTGDSNSTRKIRQLTEARDEGVLTEEEFEEKKNRVLREAASAEKIRRLAELRDEGILTQEEYERKKSQYT
jgi:hypothetical protein